MHCIDAAMNLLKVTFRYSFYILRNILFRANLNHFLLNIFILSSYVIKIQVSHETFSRDATFTSRLLKRRCQIHVHLST